MLNPLPNESLPEADVAKALYEETYDGYLNPNPEFGIDPLEEYQALKDQREIQFSQLYPLDRLFRECVNERPFCGTLKKPHNFIYQSSTCKQTFHYVSNLLSFS